MGKLARKSVWEPPVVPSTGIMNMGSGDPYADRDNAVKLVIASVAMAATGFMGFILYASGFNPANINLSGLPAIRLSGPGLDNLIFYGVALGMVALVISGIYRRVRSAF
jgi:hypothetical protein